MLERIRKFVAPPVFENDEDKTRIAGLLNTILWSQIVILTIINILFGLVGLFSGTPVQNSVISYVAIAMFAAMLFLVRRGFVQGISYVLAFSITGIIASSIAQSATVSASTLSGLLIPVMIAGLFTGGRGTVIISVVNILILSSFGYLHKQGWVASPPLTISELISFGAISFTSAVLLTMVSRSIQATLQRARRHQQELSELAQSLEQRVAERTQALASVAEVSTAASTVMDADALLQRVVDLAKEQFNFYHAHIYLLNEAGDSLVLSSGAGEVGRQMAANGHAIPLNWEQSLVARAARENKGVAVNDVTSDPDFLPNPLLPNTHAELAVPMVAGQKLIGVLDVQSDQVGRFTESDIAVQTTLASQVASAVQNARSYTEIQRSQAQLAEALSISRLANWEYDFNNDLFHFNDHFYSIFRTSVEKVGSYKISSADYARNFVHPDDAALVGSEIQRVLESKERHFKTELEHRIIFGDGEIGYIAVKINVDRDENGKLLRWYGANQDVTERRRLEELNRTRAVQQETINVITQKIQAATTIEEAMQVAARELGHALGKRQTMVALDPGILSDRGHQN